MSARHMRSVLTAATAALLLACGAEEAEERLCVVSGCPCVVDDDCIDPLICEAAIGACAAPAATPGGEDAGGAADANVAEDAGTDGSAPGEDAGGVPDSATGADIVGTVRASLTGFCDRYEGCGGDREICDETADVLVGFAEGALVTESGDDAETFAECAPGYVAVSACIDGVTDCPTIVATMESDFILCPEESAIFEGVCGEEEFIDDEGDGSGDGEGSGDEDGSGDGDGSGEADGSGQP